MGKPTKIQKPGNSLAVIIPDFLVQKLKLEKGDEVDVDANGDTITIKKTEGNEGENEG